MYEPQRFVGVDYSSRKVAAAVIGDSDAVKAMSTLSYGAPKKLTGVNAMKEMLGTFSNWATDGWLLDAAVVIESPIVGGSRNIQTGMAMAMAAGGLMQASFHYGAATVQFAAPSSWKKKVCGDGALHKQEVSEWLRLQHEGLFATCKTDDDTDAMCLALYAAMEEE